VVVRRLQNVSDPIPRGTFSNFGVEFRGREKWEFSRENGPYLGNGER